MEFTLDELKTIEQSLWTYKSMALSCEKSEDICDIIDNCETLILKIKKHLNE